ncbi:MAG: 2-oxoglutarate dehydrogenase E1 component [Gammaproteobacteria bacterium]
MSNPGASCLYGDNAAFIEALYEQYLENPDTVAPEWRDYFNSLNASAEGQQGASETSHTRVQQFFLDAAKNKKQSQAQQSTAVTTESHLVDNKKQASVLQLINAHRFRGHQQADLDPIRQYKRHEIPELDPNYYQFTEADMQQVFNTGSLFAADELPLKDIINIVRTTYCRTIGAEYMHINETEQKRWIQQRMEETMGMPQFDEAQKKRILNRVMSANILEEYLHTKYVGQKRFSLEGGESLIALLDEIVQDSGENGTREAVIGMAHRGRLNVLVNTIGKLPHELFSEFEGKNTDIPGSGDVKYHLGYSSDIHTPGGTVHLTLSFNPSHLEIIDPVVEGSVRARQDRRNDKSRNQVLAILIHGDAAFAGQGVVMETLNLSQTRGYSTGGTVHIIINNQIGFTTSDPLDSRSTLYCTDVAKMVQAPIFHVNGDDPEAVAHVAKIALDFRMQYNKDVVIDMVCYRKHGHSESDEPAATQPIMYKAIRGHKDVLDIYTEKLVEEGVTTHAEVDAMAKTYVESLESNQSVAGTLATDADTRYMINYEPFRTATWNMPTDTKVAPDTIAQLTEILTTVPEHFDLHPTVARIMRNRRKMGAGEQEMDWGFAENLAYAALLREGYPIRISGQDSGRGTFFHRHAVIHNQQDGDKFLPLQHIREEQPSFLVINSILSEEAVLAFEYGYSASEPNALVIWEAQFGDFANGAQVVFDQFISSCEAKWGRYCGLTVLLPHGYDGQGPEHSSARLERFLQLCAQENMQVCYPSTPAQMFHMLRRQMLRPYRKPLIVMSPKSLLRHKLSTSGLDELSHGQFQLTIDEIDDLDKSRVTRLLICSGKVYFDLLAARRENQLENIAITRIEQLFPFPASEMKAIIDSYSNATEVVWVQEEPRNQGSWYYIQSSRTIMGCLSEQHTFSYVGRAYSASPAAGYVSLHQKQQNQLIEEALQLDRVETTARVHSA